MIDFALLLFVPVLFVIGMNRPDRLLLLWLLLSPLSYNTLVVFGLDLRVVSFDRLALLASMGGLLASGRFGELFPNRFSKLEKAFLVFFLVFLFEGVLKFPLRDVFSVWTNAIDCYLIPFYLYLLTRYLLTRDGQYDEDMEGRIAKVLVIVGFYCAAMSIFEGLTHIDLLPGRSSDGLRAEGGSMRTNGPFWAAGVLGTYLSWILLFAMYRWRVRRLADLAARPVRKWITVPYTVLMVSGLFFVMFRNAWGGFLGGCSIRYLFTRRGRVTLVLVSFLLTVGFALNWQTVAQSSLYQERISNVDNIYDRLGAWLYAFRAFSENPLTGIGTGQIKYYIHGAQARGDDLRVMDIPATYHPHNSVIAMLAENGLLGGIPFCLVIWFFLGEVRACVRLSRSPADLEFGIYAVSAAFAILATGLTDRSFEWAKSNHLMYLIFALVAAHHTKLVASVDAGAGAGTARLGGFVPEPAESLTY